MKKIISILGLAVAIGLMVVAGAMAAHTHTVVVSGDTAAGYNEPGWLFARDSNNATPYKFNEDEASIGDGSLYVEPISATADHKFIGENFLNGSMADVNSISYDFMIGSGGDSTDANEFYMNVYANFGESDDDKFYDCRYSIVPSTGSTSGWTTVTFDPTDSHAVTTSSSSPVKPCPPVPADMDDEDPGSTIRQFSLNVGDTSANDEGLDGYLDNVVVNTDDHTTTYDFEAPDTEAPLVEITDPTDDSTVNGLIDIAGSVTDNVELSHYNLSLYPGSTDLSDGETHSGDRLNDSRWCTTQTSGTVNLAADFTGDFCEDWDTTQYDDGEYQIRLAARDAEGNRDTSDPENGGTSSVHVIDITINNVPDTKDQCKNDGWMNLVDEDGESFRNQGDCVSYVASEGKSRNNPGRGR